MSTGKGADMSHTISIMGFGTHSAKLSISATADTKEDARKALDDVANALNNHDRLTAEVGRLREALKTAIDWIRNAPEDTWGDGSNSEGMRWPIRDELADQLCKALNPEEPK